MTWLFGYPADGVVTASNPYVEGSRRWPATPLDVASFGEYEHQTNGAHQAIFYTGEPIVLRKWGAVLSNQPRGPVNSGDPNTTNPAAAGETLVYDLSRLGLLQDPADRPTPPTAGPGLWTYDGAPLGPGCYMFVNKLVGDLSTSDPHLADSRLFYGRFQGDILVNVVRQHAGRPRPPAGYGPQGKYGRDLAYTMAWLGFGMVRQQFPDIVSRAPTAPNDGGFDHNWNYSLQAAHDWWIQYDTSRAKLSYVQMENPQGVDPVTAQAIRDWVAYYPQVQSVGMPNEPWGAQTVDSGYIPVSQQIYQNVKAVRPDMLVVGMNVENLSPTQWNRQKDYYSHGGGDWADIVGVHAYPESGLGDDIRKYIDYYQDYNKIVLAPYGQHTKRKMNTEAFTTEAMKDGTFHPLQQASQIMVSVLAWEQFGLSVPGSSTGCKEFADHFYSNNHGAYGTAPMAQIASGGLYPAGLCMHTHGHELHGIPSDGYHGGAEDEIEFGDRRHFIGGHTYARRPDGTGLAVMKQTGPAVAPVRFRLTGGSAIPANMTHVLGWGWERTIPVVTEGSEKTVTLNLDRVPQHYLRLPDGVDMELEVIPTDWRARRLIPVGTSFNGPATGVTTASFMTNNKYPNSLNDRADQSLGLAISAFSGAAELGTAGGSDTATANFGAFVDVDYVEVMGITMFNVDSALLKFVVEGETAPGVWEEFGSRDETVRADVQNIISFVGQARQVVMWDHTTLWEIDRSANPLRCRRMRLRVLNTTTGGAYDVDGMNGYDANALGLYDSQGGWKGNSAAFNNAKERFFVRGFNSYGTRAGKRAIFKVVRPVGEAT